MIDFIKAHPELVFMIVTAVVTAIFKPRTPEEYASLPPRVAAFLKLVAALGLDPVKGVQALAAMLSGEKDPENKLPPPGAGPLALLFLCIVLGTTGCGGTLPDIKAGSDVTADKLAKCRGDARAEFYVGQKSFDESMAVYTACKKREGL